jgi:hypothetical protein
MLYFRIVWACTIKRYLIGGFTPTTTQPGAVISLAFDGICSK